MCKYPVRRVFTNLSNYFVIFFKTENKTIDLDTKVFLPTLDPVFAERSDERRDLTLSHQQDFPFWGI